MRKQMSLFVCMISLLGFTGAMANSGMYGASSTDLTSGPGKRSKTSVNYEKYETRSSKKTYAVKDGNSMYYTGPDKRGTMYKTSAGTDAVAGQNVRTTRTETLKKEARRKYYLAHPFFQPLQGKFGSVTDLSYAMGSYDVKINQTSGLPLNDFDAKWDMGQFSIKQDLSYGITDTISIMGMARFSNTKYEFDWKTVADDSMKKNKFDIFGAGAQWRFVDNTEWIATLSGYYQKQVDIADIFILDLKAGYKVGMTTIYGLGRAWYSKFEGNAYGNGMSNDDSAFLIAYKVDDSKATYLEGGIGIFSVLEEDWTLNLEAIFGNYEWHNQGSIKGAIGWQPGNSFALNLYAKTTLYDSADGKNLKFYWYQPAAGVNQLTEIGTAKIGDYSETTIGLQAIFYF